MRRLLIPLAVAALLGICSSGIWMAQSAKNSEAAPGSYLNISGAKIYYEECGNALQNIVLLHDGVLHSAAWDDVWPELCKKFHVIRYDRRGYGQSPASTEGYFETDDLVALMKHLKISRAAIVGSSHGGEISIDFALAHPEMTQELILVGAVVGGMPYSKHFLDRGEVLGKPLEKGDVQGAITAAMNDKYLIAARNDSAKKRMASLLSANPQDLTHPSFEMTPKPALPRLHQITVPTLVLVGDEDITDVHAHAGAIEAGIPRARRVVVAGVGHLMYLEKPKEFADLVGRFLEQNN